MQRVCFKRFLSNGVRQVEEEIRKRLKQLVDKHGSELGYNPQRLEALLKDYCGEYKREINLLVIAAREGTAREMLNTSGTKLGTWDFQRLVRKLCEDTGMSEDFARWAVESWALAFRNNPPGKQKQTSISGRPFEGEPQCVKSWAKEADRQDQLSLHEKATEYYDRALEINPQYASAWADKGSSLSKLGRYEEAIECYDKALEINPNLDWVWRSKAFSLTKLGRHDEAKYFYDQDMIKNQQRTDS
jgi:tetratricopeptide (TPR) repeat protein